MEQSLTAWSRYLAGFPAESSVREAIVSWDPPESAEPVDAGASRFVDERELAIRKAHAAALLDAAVPHLEWISAFLGARSHVVYLVDADGVVLFSIGSLAHELAPGLDARNNGAGTALEKGSPVAVLGPEHLLERYPDCTSIAAPIHGPDGHLLGAVDVTTRSGEADPERLAVVSHVAWTIERELVNMMLRDRLHSHDRLRRVVEAAVEHLPHAMLVASVDRTFVCASRGAEALLDGGRVGIDLQAVALVASDGQRWTLDGLVERSRRGEHVDLEGRFGERSLSVCATPLWDGANIVGVVLMFSDAETSPCSGHR